MPLIAETALLVNSRAVDRYFDYTVPAEIAGSVAPGCRVAVPFGNGNRTEEAIVLRLKDSSDYPAEKLKGIISALDDWPLLNPVMLDLAAFMREKYRCTLAACLDAMLPPGLEKGPLLRPFVYLGSFGAEALPTLRKKSPRQAAIIDALIDGGGVRLSELRKKLGVSMSSFESLAKKGYIKIEAGEVMRNPLNAADHPSFGELELTVRQREVFDDICARLEPGYSGQKTVLLHGVTGSGKTEIYMRLISRVIEQGKQAIMLVPEIALTPQTVRSFAGRFGSKVSVTHSRLSPGERFDQWRAAREGRISVMIGPRSALFTPFDRLGAVIIDEEHEATYKSETTPKYHVKELSAELSRLSGCLVLLGSATPSLDSYFQTECGRISLLELPERINKTPPTVHVIDMRAELLNGNRSVFGERLREAIELNLLKREQIMLYLNRRGHSTFVSCRACGHVLSCDNCSINLTYHIASGKLMCHYCGKESRIPEHCPVCGSEHIRYFGTGTQKIEEELRANYPSARVLRMDFDTTSGKHGHELVYRRFLEGQADILIGTQMIAKGLDFPKVSLVGIIAADLGIHMGDFRSAERAFQLITQVSGRAGRAELPGRVYIQTYNPEHYALVYAAKNDYLGFYNSEMNIRRQMQYPPYTMLFVIVISGEDEKRVVSALILLHKILLHYNKRARTHIFSPSPAAVSKVKNVYRHKIIIKGFHEDKLKNFASWCIAELEKYGDMDGLTVDGTLDPANII